jgi:hypothetical protein
MCSGSGTCSPGLPVDCQNYACTTSGCKVSCQTDNDCAAGRICTNGTCGPKRDVGMPCTNNSQCVNNQCVDNVCCGTASCGACNTCAGTGACHAVGDGTTDSKCAVQSPNTCGTNGTCQGGACANYSAQTMCSTAHCEGNTLVKDAFCSGSGGACAPVRQACGAYKCDPAGCRNPCGGDGDCVNPNDVCNAGVCEAPPPPDDAGPPTD